MIVATAELGELIMRSLIILRQLSLVEAGVGPVLLGRHGSAPLDATMCMTPVLKPSRAKG
jgi:hypothetical protein